MPEAGGPATQAGIFYQNTVAALFLSSLLDFDPHPARERVLEVRVEAPEEVDDLVIRYADDHREFISVKLNLSTGSSSWTQAWRRLWKQSSPSACSENDQLSLIIGVPSADSRALSELCERASSALDEHELRSRLTGPQQSAFDSISGAIGSGDDTLGLLRRISVRHLSEAEIESELTRRKLAGGLVPPVALLAHLRDIAGGQARRRGWFRAAPLRRQLKLHHGIDLAEPPEWGLASYRAAISRLARIAIPGTRISGPAEELFVWPSARELDLTQHADFEEERAGSIGAQREASIDLQAFPSELLDRIVIVAGPGYGKSALLTAISGQLATSSYVPVTIPLASMAANDMSVMDFLASHIGRELDVPADWRRLAEQGLLTLLFDGLDEVPARSRPLLIERISNFSARYPHAPWILTVRDPMVVTGLSEARTIELLPLSDDDIERFIQAMKPHIGDVDSWQLVRRLERHPDLDRLARIPLFLMMLLVTVDLSNPKPITRSDLIESYLTTLFAPANHKRIPDYSDYSTTLRSIAEVLAYERIERQEIGASEREVREVINRMASSPKEAGALFDRLTANGILQRQSAIRLQFPYPIVQEYLAACHLVERHRGAMETKIEDAIQRPWAQVIQFTLELHPAPEPIIRQMLTRPDDAFCTGLRLIGRCIANGAKVSEHLLQEVRDRLVDYWVHAPSQSRDRVGSLLSDGFLVSSPSPALRKALHHRWLLNDGAGDILSKLHDVDLTLSVLRHLMEKDNDGFLIYHSLMPALNAAGDLALEVITQQMDPEVVDPDRLVALSSVLSNFDSSSVSRETALSMARDSRLPAQARMRWYVLADSPLEQEGVALVVAGLQSDDWDRHYAASELIRSHTQPGAFLEELLRDKHIPTTRKVELAAEAARILNAEERRAFSKACISDDAIDSDVRLTFQLFEARHGDRPTFETLVEGISHNPIQHVGTTIALFGHFRDRALAEHAATLADKRVLSPADAVQIANSVTSGMFHVYEMDYGFGGALRNASPHPGNAAWMELMERWSDRGDLSPRQRIGILAVATELGSDYARSALEEAVLSIDDFDGREWRTDDAEGHVLNRALREVRRRRPLLSQSAIERILRSSRFNIATAGIEALKAEGTTAAIERLIQYHSSVSEWHLRDTVANALESMAAKQGVMLLKKSNIYRLSTATR